VTARLIRFLALLVTAWTIMALTHEVGHLVGGWAGGGTLQSAELRPWRLPHSHFAPDPAPLATLWSGPALGVLAPLALAMLLHREAAWFVAYFCLLANGTYLALSWASGEPHLDGPRLLAHGASPLALGVYCTATIGSGYWGFRRCCLRLLKPAAIRRSARKPAA
jgi:hypothetical protein